MPTSFAGVIIFIALLTPGLLNYIQRRRLSEQPQVSALVETAALTTISLITDLLAIGIFSIVRAVDPRHTPDVALLLKDGWSYATPRLGYLILWGAGIIAISCTIAIVWAVKPGPLAKLPFFPTLIETSAWVQKFESIPVGSSVYLGCQMRNGDYIAGFLDWYNTNVDEVPDRDLVLAAPLMSIKDGKQVRVDWKRVILSAHDIERIYVDYVDADLAHAQQKGLA